MLIIYEHEMDAHERQGTGCIELESRAPAEGVPAYRLREWLEAGRPCGYQFGGTKAGWRISDADLRRFREERQGERSEG